MGIFIKMRTFIVLLCLTGCVLGQSTALEPASSTVIAAYDNISDFIDDPSISHFLLAAREFYTHFSGLQFFGYGAFTSLFYIAGVDAMPESTVIFTVILLAVWSPAFSYIYYLIEGNNETEWILIAINIFITYVLGVDSGVLWSIVSP